MASQFARARAPYVVPTAAEFEARYRLLGIDPDHPLCAYCGGPPSEWDHLMPMVVGSAWSGHITEIANLIPACGKCNQSRGSKAVGTWMRSHAPFSPLSVFQRRGMSLAQARSEVERRVTVIENAIRVQPPRLLTRFDDADEQALERCRLALNDVLREAECIATRLRSRYQDALTPDLPAAQQIG